MIATNFNTRTGKSHVAKGRPCEDSVNAYKTKNTAAVCLADGCGSCENSRLGSSAVSVFASEYMAKNFDELFSSEKTSQTVHTAVYGYLENYADSIGVPIESLGTTLLSVGVHKDGRYILLAIGDGSIFGADKDNNVDRLYSFDHEYSNSITDTVTDKQSQCFVLKGSGKYSSFLLTSDGAEYYLDKNRDFIKTTIASSFLLSEKQANIFIDELTQFIQVSLKELDDLSIGVITNISEIEKQKFDKETLNGLTQTKISRRETERQIKTATRLIKSHNGKIGCKELLRKLHFRKKRIMIAKLRKWNFSIENGYVSLKE